MDLIEHIIYVYILGSMIVHEMLLLELVQVVAIPIQIQVQDVLGRHNQH